MTDFNLLVEKMEKRLKYLNVELDEFGQTALAVPASQKEDFDQKFIALRADHDLAQAKLEELRGAGEHKWETFKEALELSVRDLEAAFSSAENPTPA